MVPGHELLVAYAGSHAICYVVDEDRAVVSVELIEDQRRDPKGRLADEQPSSVC